MGYYSYGIYDDIYNTMAYSYRPIVYAVVAVIAVILGVVLFFTMLRKKNEKKYTGVKAKIYHFLNVNKFYTEDIIRLLYVVTVCVLTLLGLTQIVLGSFLSGILILVAGNVAARVSYECLLMFFILVRKTVAIDRKLTHIEKFYGDDFDEPDCIEPDCVDDEAETEGCEADAESCGSCDDCCSCCGSQEECSSGVCSESDENHAR